MRTNFTCADHFTPNIRNAFNLILRLLGVHCTVVLIKLLNDGKTMLLTKDKKITNKTKFWNQLTFYK